MTNKFSPQTKSLAIFFTLIFTLFLTAAPVISKDKTSDIGVSAGLWLSGEIDIEGYDVDKDPGLMLRGFYDSYMSENMCVGLFANLGQIEISAGGESESGNMIELGVTIKPVFMASPTIKIKPGLNLGYRMIDVDVPGVEDVKGLGVNASVEIIFLGDGKFNWYVEPGFLAQPAGGNDDADVTFAPILYIVGGVMF